MSRKQLVFFVKLAFSVGAIVLIYGNVVGREGAGELWARARGVHLGWLLAAVGMQFGGVTASVLRWDLLLRGQGIRAPFRHLVGSFMIGRFFGAFTPAGLGLQGYRLWDIAVQTGKTARSTATIAIEMVLGWLAFGSVVVAGSFFGARFVGARGVLLIDLCFVGLIAMALLLITRPVLFRVVAGWLPAGPRARVQTTVDAACAYQGRGPLVGAAAVLAMGTHAFHALLYVCSAQALGVDLGVGEVFFASAIQIFSTLMPVSINGIGLREATAVALYTAVGVPGAVAVLIPTLGFAVEMVVSSFGGLVFLARRVGYRVVIAVEAPEQEQYAQAQIEPVPREAWPELGRGTVLGFGGGMLGGVLLGVGEAAVVLGSARGALDWGVFAYGGALYGLAFAFAGAAAGFALAWSGRLLARRAVAEPAAIARIAAMFVAVGAFGIGAFRIRRDVFHEALKWKSLDGLLVLGGCAVAAAVTYLALAYALRVLVERRPLRFMLRAWGAPVVLVAWIAVATGIVVGGAAEAAPIAGTSESARSRAPAAAGNVLVIVVDTLRADHLPAYGYGGIATPHLDRFVADAVVFRHAYANASWTRPSFASILTGRYPSSHRTTRKPDALPDELVTFAEAMHGGGYTTLGVVTNYNVAPFFNFQQGFDHYLYLEPAFVLGANDTAAKLLLAQFLRQKIEGIRARSGRVERGSAYQDAEIVNEKALALVDGHGEAPWFLFVGYMDPHDPYYPHPYDGTGYSRAANQHPKPEAVDTLRKLYDGEIVYWDAHFGRLVDALKKRGVYDDMTIVVTADHGEEFMEHGGYWHGTTLYDEQVGVPLVVKLPRNERAGTEITHWVQSIDIMPSVLARAGLAVPDGVQGEDLWTPSESAFAEEDHEGNVLRALRMRRGGEALKVIEANPGNPRGLDPFELYRVEQDPGELVDLAREEKELLGLAATELDRNAREAEQGRVSRRSVDVAANAAAVEKLRALGYAGGE